MNRYGRTSWLRFLTAALLALAAGAAVAPAAARASCGDYVTVAKPAAPSLPRSTPLPARPEKVTPCSRHDSEGPVPPCRLPCYGPGCSGLPQPAPAPASAAGTSAGQDQWDCLLILPVCAHTEAAAPQPDGTRGRPVRRGPSVYHPPRPA
jgi:hypothetical protein